MPETASTGRFKRARFFTLLLIAVIVLLCLAVATGASQFVRLYEQEKSAQKDHQEKIEAVMTIESSVLDLQAYVLDGDPRMRDRLAEKSSRLEALFRDHSGDKDYKEMYEAFGSWQQTLAQPMMQKRRQFDTAAMDFSALAVSYIQGNAPMHERRLAELNTQVLQASQDNLDAVHLEISGLLVPALLVIAILGIIALLLSSLLWRALRPE